MKMIVFEIGFDDLGKAWKGIEKIWMRVGFLVCFFSLNKSPLLDLNILDSSTILQFYNSRNVETFLLIGWYTSA